MVGFDKDAINFQLLFAPSLDEYAAGATPPSYDKAKPHHTCTLHGGAWNALASGLPYIDLSPNPDWIDCPAAATADLNFTAGDFSMVIWIAPDALAVPLALLGRGLFNTDGWTLQTQPGGGFTIFTYQAGAVQGSNALLVLTVGTWTLVGISRSGAIATTFANGVDVTQLHGNHVNPLTANRELHIGVEDDEATHRFDGKIAGGLCGPRIWGRKLEPHEFMQLFNMERHWFGV